MLGIGGQAGHHGPFAVSQMQLGAKCAPLLLQRGGNWIEGIINYIREATSRAMNTTPMANPDAPEWCVHTALRGRLLCSVHSPADLLLQCRPGGGYSKSGVPRDKGRGGGTSSGH